MMKPLRFAVIGTGALGAFYGSLLARSGRDVHFLLRSDFEHVRDHGIRVDSVRGDFHLPHVNAYRDATSMPPCDVTIVALKTTQNHLLPDLLPTATREGGVVLVLQNGLDVEQQSAEIVGGDRVLGGCCFLCCNKIGPGHIRHLDFGRVVFGALQPHSTAAQLMGQLTEEMLDAGIDVQSSDDLQMVRWRKLMWNIPFNGLSVTLDASTQEIVEQAESAAIAEALIAEVHSAATACGVNIDPAWIEKTMSNTRAMAPYDSSMRLDFLAQREMELESIFARPIQRAAENGFAMPRVEMLYRNLCFIQSRFG